MAGKAEMKLALDTIKLDECLQSRQEIDQDYVDELTEVLGDGGELPPLVVFHDGGVYWLADGWHRYLAYKAADRKKVPVLIRQGTRRDALFFSFSANAKHGKRRTNADKRKSVTTLLEDCDWTARTNRWVAAAAKVSNHLVHVMRAELNQADVSDEPPAASVGKSPNSILESPEKNDSSLSAPSSEHSPSPTAKAQPQKRTGRDGGQYKTTKPAVLKKPAVYELLPELAHKVSPKHYDDLKDLDPERQRWMLGWIVKHNMSKQQAEANARAGNNPDTATAQVQPAEAVTTPAATNGHVDPEPSEDAREYDLACSERQAWRGRFTEALEACIAILDDEPEDGVRESPALRACLDGARDTMLTIIG